MGKAQYTELPPWERSAHYREMARETEELGQTGSPEFRETCRQFAVRWRLLANELMTSGFEDVGNDAAERMPRRQSVDHAASPPQPKGN